MNRRQIYIVILIAFVVGALGSIFFDRLIIPELSKIRGLSWLATFQSNSPIVITRTEHVQLNEGVNIIELIKQAQASTVSIYTGSGNNLKLAGSGIILTSDGLVITTKEVVGSAGQFTIVLRDGKTAAGTLRALDPKSEIAIITIASKDLPIAEFGDARALQAGQRIIALGKSFSEFNRDVATGFVTRAIANANTEKIYSSEIFEDTFETDAHIKPDFVGGPVINLDGKLVGVVANSSGKILVVENLATALDSYLDTGKIIRVSFGFKYQKLPKATASLKGLAQEGMLVISVDEGRAKASGLLASDLIIKVDSEQVNLGNFEKLINRYGKKEMKLGVLRNDKELELILK